jgi:glutamate/tyrosine decarboxylase-like PLP-dependent enzyme
MSEETRVQPDLFTSVLEYSKKYYSGLRDRRVSPTATHDELLRLLDRDLPAQGDDPQAILDALMEAGDVGTMASSGPRFFGFVIGGSIPTAAAADWLATVWDQNVGLYILSPLATVAEEISSRWLLDIFGLPPTASVGFVTGCQGANLVGLAAGRNEVLRRAGWSVSEQGLQGAPRVHVVVGDEAHVTIFGALHVLGIGKAQVKRVPADSQGRMRGELLPDALAECDGPTIVCAQAGNVNTGAFDPLREIAEASQAHGAWMHVDGAFGLWAAATPELQLLLDGVELADSWATDAHKWLNVPYDSGLAIVRHPEAHADAFSRRAAYLPDPSAMRDSYIFTPEFSRRARGLAVYAALRALGRAGIRELVENSCRCARRFAALLARHPRVQILNDVVLNQVLVRFDDGKDPDDLTRRVIARIQQEGTCWMGGTTWKEMFAMRISVSGWMTTEQDIELSAQAVLKSLEREHQSP